MNPRPKPLFLSALLSFALLSSLGAGEVSMIYDNGTVCPNGCEQIRFSTPYFNSYPRVTTPPDNYGTAPFLDGAIAPISYPFGGSIRVRFNISHGHRNYEMTTTLSGSGPTALFNQAVSLNPTPVYSGVHDRGAEDFEWAEWLYGTFRDASTGTVYAGIYNEYYGGAYNDFVAAPITYTAMGVARSDNNGSSFYKIAGAPNHIFARTNYLYPGNSPYVGGAGMFGGIFKSPLDNLYYAIINSDTGLGAALFRTSDLNNALSWRGWSGSAFDVSGQNLGSTYYKNLDVYPLYLGWSDYFKKFIAITIGNLTGNYGSVGNNLVVYNLSDDMITWGPPRRIMYNPACLSEHDCRIPDNCGTPGQPDCRAEISAYPSIMDAGYLSDTGNSTKSSNGMTGSRPLITYIKNPRNSVSDVYQQFATQRIDFTQVATNRVDNFSVRAVTGFVRPIVMGFVLQGTEPTKVIFRGLGPSLPDFGYPKYQYPSLALYNGAGALVAFNNGWQSGPDAGYLSSIGLNPAYANESALVATLPPGNYTIQMSTNCHECQPGMALIEAYTISPFAESKIANVSIRAYGESGNGNIVMGFLSRGGETAIVRGTGQSTLAPYGFSPVIPNPSLSVTQNGATIRTNDNWSTDSGVATIQQYGLAPGNYWESATVFPTEVTLPSRYTSYSVTMQGVGFGLLELYNVQTY